MVGRVKYNVMSDQELQYLKSRMEQLLIERGIHLDHEELLSELDKLGCAVDMEKKDVRFTKELIDRAVAAVPEKFTLYSPSGKYDLEFPNPNGSFYTRTNTGAPNYRTINGDTHYTTLEEVDDVKTAVSEAVTNAVIHGYGGGEGKISMEISADAEKKMLYISIRDKGRGIPDVKKAMEPMFTTDPSGERSGMGFSFMEAFMDHLEVESAPGKGTRVYMEKRIGR